MQHEHLHRLIGLADGLRVTILLVEHRCHGVPRHGPGHIVTVYAPVARCDVAHHTVGTLRKRDVAHPFGVELVGVVDITGAISPCGVVAEPSQPLVALRTIGGYATVVAANAPDGAVVDGVDGGVRGVEGAGGGHAVVDHPPLDVGKRWLALEAAQLDKPEAVEGKPRLPGSSLVGAHVGVGDERRAQIKHEERVAVLHALGKAQPQRVALVAAQSDAQPSHHILPHVHDISAVGSTVDGAWRHAVHHLDVGVDLCAHHGRRSLDALGLPPAAVVISGEAPARHLAGGVVALAVKLVVGLYGAVGHHAPRGVGGDHRLAAVGGGHYELGQEPWQSKSAHAGVAHGHEAAVAQHHAYGVGSAPDLAGHIKGIVHHLAVVVGGSGGKHLRAYAVSVDVGFVESQSADVEHGAPYTPRDAEVAAQIAGVDAGASVLGRLNVGVEAATYPLGTPLGAVHQASEPVAHAAHGAAGCGLALYLVVVAGAAGERLSCIVDVELAVRRLTARVPEVSFALAQQLGRRCHAYAVSRLLDVGHRGIKLPAEAWSGAVYALGVVEPLDAGGCHRHSGLALGGGSNGIGGSGHRRNHQ